MFNNAYRPYVQCYVVVYGIDADEISGWRENFPMIGGEDEGYLSYFQTEPSQFLFGIEIAETSNSHPPDLSQMTALVTKEIEEIYQQLVENVPLKIKNKLVNIPPKLHWVFNS